MSEQVDSGGGGGGGGDDGGDSGGGGGGGGTVLPDILSGNTLSILKSFVANPRRFILGAVLTAILEGFFSVVSEALRIIQLIFVGSSPTRSFEGEQVWGLADIAASYYRLLGGAGLEVGAVVIQAVQSVNNPLFELAGSAGPAAPAVIAVFLSLEVVAVLLLLEYTVRILADFIPGLGGLV